MPLIPLAPLPGAGTVTQTLAPQHELIWGDYFALEAALALDGTIDPAVL